MQNVSSIHSSQTPDIQSFIKSLMLAGRQRSLYPADHPQIVKVTEEVLNLLQRCCGEENNHISLVCGKSTLKYQGEELLLGNTPAGNLHRLLTTQDIATLNIAKTLTPTELLKLFSFLWPEQKETQHTESPSSRFNQLKLENISVTFIDYANLQKAGSKAATAPSKGDQLWDELLSHVSQETGNGNRQVKDFLFEFIDRPESGNTPDKQQLGSLISRIIQAQDDKTGSLDDKTLKLAQTLSPPVLDSLLHNLFRTLENKPEEAGEIFETMPKSVISETLQRISREEINISARLLNILRELSRGANRRQTATVTQQAQTPEHSNIDVLFYEDNLDDYVPVQYQQSLNKILSDEIKSNVPEQEASEYRQNFSRFEIEQHCCDTIFELLSQRVAPDTEQNIQNNLVELSDFFLETGDFKSLRDLFTRWSNYLYSGNPHVLFLDEKVLAHQTSSKFIDEVLNSIFWLSTSLQLRH